MRQSPEESATLYNLGYKKKGLDGNIWIIKETSAGVKRWSKYTPENSKAEKIDRIVKLLTGRLEKWWEKLSDGNFLVIFKNGKYLMIKSDKKTRQAQIKEIKEKWIQYGNDKNVEAIIWSSMSADILYNFIRYLLVKLKKNELQKILDQKNLPLYLIENYKKFFIKNNLYTNKDYTFKSH
jgi:hypothetical protein